ncbi:MAG TPA: flagellar filament capping protein FliD [Sphingobium sp.]
MATSIDIASALGIGSGINTTQLVTELVAASREPKETALNTRISTNNARISALASAKSSLTSFSTALTELLKSTSYSGQPVSNDTSIASVALIAGGVPSGLPAQLEVTQLAKAQVLESTTITGGATGAAGTGKLTFAIGGSSATATSFDVTMTAPANTLTDLAKAINDKNAGVTANIVTDSNGSRLVLKGDTGEAKAFTVTSADADADLQRFVTTGGTTPLTQKQPAQNAKVNIDNVSMEFATNEITTAIPFVRIDLNKAAPGTTVTLATDQPTATMSDLVGEFVDSYNTLKTALNSSTNSTTDKVGLLSSDTGVREMSRRLATLTNTPLTDTGDYRTLSDLGISTNKDGTLKLDSVRLAKVLKDDPQAITQMLNPTVPSTTKIGLGGALKTVTDFLNGDNGPLAGSTNTYTKLQASLAEQMTTLDTNMTNYQDQLTKTYTAMQTQLATIKATQTYLTQQIAVWTKSSS